MKKTKKEKETGILKKLSFFKDIIKKQKIMIEKTGYY